MKFLIEGWKWILADNFPGDVIAPEQFKVGEAAVIRWGDCGWTRPEVVQRRFWPCNSSQLDCIRGECDYCCNASRKVWLHAHNDFQYRSREDSETCSTGRVGTIYSLKKFLTNFSDNRYLHKHETTKGARVINTALYIFVVIMYYFLESVRVSTSWSSKWRLFWSS